jgi:hypothetical protein
MGALDLSRNVNLGSYPNLTGHSFNMTTRTEQKKIPRIKVEPKSSGSEPEGVTFFTGHSMTMRTRTEKPRTPRVKQELASSSEPGGESSDSKPEADAATAPSTIVETMSNEPRALLAAYAYSRKQQRIPQPYIAVKYYDTGWAIEKRQRHPLFGLQRRGNAVPAVGTSCIVMTGDKYAELGQIAVVTAATRAKVEIAYRDGTGIRQYTKWKRPSSLIMLEKGLTCHQDEYGTVTVRGEKRAETK